jgi:hypothetical protein
MGAGINSAFRQVGIATGIAGLGAVFQHELTQQTSSALSHTAPGREALHAARGKLGAALVSGEVGALARSLAPATGRALGNAYRIGFTEALTRILLIGSAIAVVGAALALALVRRRDFVGSAQPSGPREAEPAEAGARS